MMENLRVVLVGARNPLNIGAVARAMSNFGAMHLRVVAPYEKAWREAKSAVGAAELMARAEEFATVSEAIADCTLVVGTTAVGNREIRQRLVSLVEAGPELRQKLSATRVALLFGSEKWGLSNENLSHCHWLVRIPTREEHRSMNLGQAVAVCLYELQKQKIENGKAKVGKVITTLPRESFRASRGNRGAAEETETAGDGVDGECGADYWDVVGGAAFEWVHCAEGEEIGGGEIAADDFAVSVRGWGCGSVFGDGE
jgi:TrmH family RNA methyltransferase